MRFLKPALIAFAYFCSTLVASADPSCRKLLDLPPRGFACFHCMHAATPGKAEPFVKILEQSCVQRPTLSFVLDGSFGYDETQILTAIDRLSRDGRTFFLHLYLYNGPAQRRWYAGIFSSFAIMEPVSFRHRLLADKRFQQIFRRRVQKIIPLLQYAKNAGARVSLAPAIEDNLGAVSFRKALTLIKAEIPRDLMPRLVRSPCSDCYQGNDFSLPRGIAFEKHTLDANLTLRSGVVSTDGEYFRFSGERSLANYPELSELGPLLDRAGSLGNIFHLWVAKYQDAPPGFAPRSPDARNYQAPSQDESAQLREFFRGNGE